MAFVHRFASALYFLFESHHLDFGPLPPNSESFFLFAVPKHLRAFVAPAIP